MSFVYGYLKYGHKFGVSGHIDSEFVVKGNGGQKFVRLISNNITVDPYVNIH